MNIIKKEKKEGNIKKRENSHIFVFLDNIRSVHNVGSIFRTSEALSLGHLFLGGCTPSPLDRFQRKRADLAKVSLGAEENIPWTSIKAPFSFLKKKKKEGLKIIAVEQNQFSQDYKKYSFFLKRGQKEPVIFVFGNEIKGVNKKILEIADQIIEIPMRGLKESLNVSVSFGIVMFRLFDR